MDIVSKEARSQLMAKIKTRDTEPEMVVRRMLFQLGYRFRLHRKDLPGNPDIVMPGRRIVIFVHGCFWHQHTGCKLFKMPSTNNEFWKQKLDKNVARDIIAQTVLLATGWRVLTIWECATRRPIDLPEKLVSWIHSTAQVGELGL